MKVTGYCVMNALTAGIFEVRGELEVVNGRKYVRRGYLFLRVGTDWFDKRDLAENVAREMARKKIAIMQKKIKKLEGIHQTPKWSTKHGVFSK